MENIPERRESGFQIVTKRRTKEENERFKQEFKDKEEADEAAYNMKVAEKEACDALVMLGQPKKLTRDDTEFLKKLKIVAEQKTYIKSMRASNALITKKHPLNHKKGASNPPITKKRSLNHKKGASNPPITKKRSLNHKKECTGSTKAPVGKKKEDCEEKSARKIRFLDDMPTQRLAISLL